MIKQEEDYLELERLSVKLGVPVPMMHLKVESFYKNERTGLHEGRSHSYVRNFYNYMIGMHSNFLPTGSTYGAGYLTSLEVNGTTKENRSLSVAIDMFGLVNNSNYGILVGIGTGGESFESSNLESKCTHGTGTNQLSYLGATTTTSAYTSGTKTWNQSMVRKMNNNSTADITITETGMIDYNANNGYLLMVRDLLASTVVVSVGGQLTVTYLVSLQFPS